MNITPLVADTGSPPPTARVGVWACDTYAPDLVLATLRAALDDQGGLGRFVKPGQTVLLKPNLLSARPPEQAVTTHPAVVSAMVRLCREAGAARVWVGDSSAGNHADSDLWEKTGMSAVVEAAGGELRSFRGAAHSVPCAGRRLPLPAWFEDVDVLISLPKLKTHGLTLLTCALKNVYGLVPGPAKSCFHADYPSPRTMSAFLVQVFATVRPALTVVDAVDCMEGDGPANGDPVRVGLILTGTDALAVDSVAARLLGLGPDRISMLRVAAARGLGVSDWARIERCGTGVARLETTRLKHPPNRFLLFLPEALFRIVSKCLRYRPAIEADLCVRCGICAGVCSQKAITKGPDGEFSIERRRCILCLCCMESCPRHAISIRSLFDWVQRVTTRR